MNINELADYVQTYKIPDQVIKNDLYTEFSKIQSNCLSVLEEVKKSPYLETIEASICTQLNQLLPFAKNEIGVIKSTLQTCLEYKNMVENTTSNTKKVHLAYITTFGKELETTKQHLLNNFSVMIHNLETENHLTSNTLIRSYESTHLPKLELMREQIEEKTIDTSLLKEFLNYSTFRNLALSSKECYEKGNRAKEHVKQNKFSLI